MQAIEGFAEDLPVLPPCYVVVPFEPYSPEELLEL